MRLFGVGRKTVYFAKLHAAEHGGARPVPPSLVSYRIKPEAAAAVTAFVSKPEYTQTLASAPGINSTPITELTLRPEALWRRYDAATPNGPEKVGRSSFLSYLEQPCFRIQASKSCLCGPCEEHGWQNFEDLNALIKALHLGVDVERGFLARVQKLRDFLKHDYRRMCANALNTPTNPCSAWLCIPHGLSTLTEGAFSCPCPREHKMGPVECDEIDFLIADLSRVLEEKRQLAIGRAERSAANAKNATATGASSATALAAAAASCADAAAELNERSEELQGCAKHLDLYVRHLMRKALSHTITPKLLDALKERPARAHLIADYKAKPLPSGHRETQTAGFGKKGLSLHGVTALRWDERRGDFAVLNVRVTCDDSEQTWFHTLSALRTTMDQLTDTWKTLSGAAPVTAPLPLQCLPYLEEVTLQTDGANNYDCTAFMSSVMDVFTAVGLQLVRHVITEVGDGKNLCDQDFQGAQQVMDHARAGGMNLLNAQDILDALHTRVAPGVVNVGMDLGTRSAEPKKNPRALKGIDALYDREYEYDADGTFLGIRVRQFFGLGAGQFVTKAELQQLWKVDASGRPFDASVIQPTVMLPRGGARPVEPRLKLSQEHNLEKFSDKRARDNAREQRRAIGSLAAYAAELQRQQEATSHRCRFTEHGCRHRPFLRRSGADAHAARCPFNPVRESDAKKASVRLRIWAGGAVRLDLTCSGRVGPHGGGKVTASLSLIGHSGVTAVRSKLRTLRPRLGSAYGLQPHTAVHELSTAEARRDAAATQGRAVHVRLAVEAGSRHVSVALTARGLGVGANLNAQPQRDPPEARPRGWAIRPPPSVERYSPERVAYLTELYDWPDGRLNEHQAFELFKKKFAADDGPYARSQRLTRAQIKAWFGSEKARRKKAGAAAALREALPDDPGEGGGAKQKPKPTQKGSGGAASSAAGKRRRAAVLESSSEEEQSEDEEQEEGSEACG